MMVNTMEPFLYVPLLTGEHPSLSKLLPTAFKRVTGATTTQNVNLTINSIHYEIVFEICRYGICCCDDCYRM